MKEYIKNIIAESLKDEVDVDREWERLFSSIEKKTISKMKTRRLFLQYMKYAAAVLLGIGISLSTLYLTNQENLSTVGNYKLVTSKGEKSYLQLPDGTKVWLNSCTTLEYAENYGHSNRNFRTLPATAKTLFHFFFFIMSPPLNFLFISSVLQCQNAR